MAGDLVADAERLIAKGDFRAAEIQLKNAVKEDPDRMEARYELGVLELRLGDPVAAETQAEVARAKGYDLDRVIPLLARSYLAQGKYAEVLSEFSPTDGGPERRAGVLVARGYALAALGKADDALASFTQAHQLKSDAIEPLLGAARVYIAQGKLPEASAALAKAEAIDQKSPELLLVKADLLKRKGDVSGALAALGGAISAAPDPMAARLERAGLLLSQGQDALAKADIAAVLKTHPNSGMAVYLEAVLFARAKHYQEADADLQKISGLLGKIAPAYRLLAIVKYNLRETAEAVDAASRYAARNPNSLAAQKLLAQLELETGHPDRTIALLEEFEKSGQADAGALDLLGRAFASIGDSSRAFEIFQNAAKLAPNSPLVQMQLAGVQLRTGDSDAAIGDFERAFKLAPSSAAAAEMLVLADLAAGHFDDAAVTAQKLIKERPTSPIGANLAGVVKLSQMDLDSAKKLFAEIVSTHPDYVPAQLNLVRVDELQGQLGEAENILSKIIQHDPTNITIIRNLISVKLQLGDRDGAKAAVTKVENQTQKTPTTTAAIVDLYLQLGEKDKAVALARTESGENSAQNAPLIMARARAELAVGLTKDAVATYRRLVSINPNALLPRQQLASILLSSGDAVAARKVIEEGLVPTAPAPGLVTDLIMIDLKSSGIGAALATAERLQHEFPSLPTGRMLTGDVYAAAQRFGEAFAAYQKEFQANPSADLVLRLAAVKWAQKKPDEALALLRTWLSAHPNELGIASRVADYDLSAKRFDQAQSEWEAIVAKRSMDAVALDNLAWLYQQRDDPRALPLAERAYVLTPRLGQVADTLGWILLKGGRPTIALQLLRQATAEQPSVPAIRYHLAVALKETGHGEEATQLLTSILKESSTFDERPAAEKLLSELHPVTTGHQ